MNNRIETEKKYFCDNSDELINKIKGLNFKLVKETDEKDEYFTDIKSKFIKKRTCLRIRTSNGDCEITFKAKSKDFNSSYIKLENNFKINSENYENFVNLFSMIGYYSYTIVNKNRYTYQKKQGDFVYSIMVDNLPRLGGFVEFEILCDNGLVDEDNLRNKLTEFVSLFNSLNLEEAKLPYRDFVAIEKYNEVKPKEEIEGVHLNLDKILINYEKDFYNYYKLFMKDEFNIDVKWIEFKKDLYSDRINENIINKINNYFDNLIIKDSLFMVLFKLVKQLKKKDLKVILSTNLNGTFIRNLIKRISKNEIFDEIILLDSNRAIYNELSKYKINLKNYFDITNYDLKDAVSMLFIIINNIDITE